MRKVKKKKWRLTLRIRIACWVGLILVSSSLVWWSYSALLSAVVKTSGAFGLLLEDIAIEGRSRVSEASLNTVLQPWRGQPMLALSVWDVRDKIQSLTWVKSATVRKVWPFTLHIKLIEFEPIATWHHQGKAQWVDKDGQVICISDGSMPQLPVISGEDAPHQIATFLAEVRNYETLWSHVTAFLHIRKRRWNIMIDHTMLVKLPQDNPQQALKLLDNWLASGKVHPSQIAALDLRVVDKYVIRPQTGVPIQIKK